MIRLKPSLKAGQKAPDFSLPDAQGKVHRLAEFAGRWLVVFFYPADFTSGCTTESCAFRDQYQAFKEAGAEVLGVSGDSSERHAAFAAEYRLPYALLSDPGAVMRHAYTVPHVFGRMSGRTTFVIDPAGVLRLVFDSRDQPLAHIAKSLEAIRLGNA